MSLLGPLAGEPPEPMTREQFDVARKRSASVAAERNGVSNRIRSPMHRLTGWQRVWVLLSALIAGLVVLFAAAIAPAGATLVYVASGFAVSAALTTALYVAGRVLGWVADGFRDVPTENSLPRGIIQDIKAADELANHVASHTFGAVVGIAGQFEEALAPIMGELPNGVRNNIVLEPLFFAVLHYRETAARIFAAEAYRKFADTVDEVLLWFLSDIFFEYEKSGVEPETAKRAKLKLAKHYGHWLLLRQQQYERVRGRIILRLYRLINGQAWFDALFLKTLISNDFRDERIVAPAATMQWFVDSVVSDVHAQSHEIQRSAAGAA